jgi:hypothetical protein
MVFFKGLISSWQHTLNGVKHLKFERMLFQFNGFAVATNRVLMLF